MAKDVVLNKIATIERCIRRIHEEYDGFEVGFKSDFTKQDSIVLNLERTSQATIDIATHIIRDKKLGLPNTSRELFVLLNESHIITERTSVKMQAMVGFRNIAVHDYQNLNIDIVIAIVEKHLVDFDCFREEVFENYLC
ncbi:MAG TPA: DUF86 domain-containing protein [Campylobacterales bacterium]|nr:DUF86 domain-containing protein [Campylobacterales bacterium]